MYGLDSDNGRWICNHCDQYFPEECKCKKLPKTHDGKCWVRHAECAIAKVNGLQAEVERLQIALRRQDTPPEGCACPDFCTYHARSRFERLQKALEVIGSHGKDYGGEWCQNEAEAALRGEEQADV